VESATTGNVAVIKELLGAGADKSITYERQTALDIAEKNHLQPAIDLLRKENP
jgi:ankyrin repeat protein